MELSRQKVFLKDQINDALREARMLRTQDAGSEDVEREYLAVLRMSQNLLELERFGTMARYAHGENLREAVSSLLGYSMDEKIIGEWLKDAEHQFSRVASDTYKLTDKTTEAFYREGDLPGDEANNIMMNRNAWAQLALNVWDCYRVAVLEGDREMVPICLEYSYIRGKATLEVNDHFVCPDLSQKVDHMLEQIDAAHRPKTLYGNLMIRVKSERKWELPKLSLYTPINASVNTSMRPTDFGGANLTIFN
ncbi:MAG TPA: hypothetical protein VJB12_02785 [Candidatus Nanoarchaeia archaeon]|nr:hypothetical protein [Candidatus Nanoarchaeia archaeon]